MANGLPREGTHAGSPYIGDVAQRDVPVCYPSDRVGEVTQRLQAAGWDQCVVVNREGVVLGLLQGDGLHAAPAAAVEWAMEAAPTTIRPNRSLSDVRADLRQHGAERVVVTTSGGQLVGIVEREDIERHLAPPCSHTQGDHDHKMAPS